jgi:hypothetical protein
MNVGWPVLVTAAAAAASLLVYRYALDRSYLTEGDRAAGMVATSSPFPNGRSAAA